MYPKKFGLVRVFLESRGLLPVYSNMLSKARAIRHLSSRSSTVFPGFMARMPTSKKDLEKRRRSHERIIKNLVEDVEASDNHIKSIKANFAARGRRRKNQQKKIKYHMNVLLLILKKLSVAK